MSTCMATLTTCAREHSQIYKDNTYLHKSNIFANAPLHTCPEKYQGKYTFPNKSGQVYLPKYTYICIIYHVVSNVFFRFCCCQIMLPTWKSNQYQHDLMGDVTNPTILEGLAALARTR